MMEERLQSERVQISEASLPAHKDSDMTVARLTLVLYLVQTEAVEDHLASSVWFLCILL